MKSNPSRSPVLVLILIWVRRFALLLAWGGSMSGASAADISSTDKPAEVGWWRDAVFYEIFVRSFADATTGPFAGDGIGDLAGLIEKLDYLNDGRGAAGESLGITALWLMPIHASPSYHGYDVSDYFSVHPEFGDMALFKRFLTEAHRRGIRVIIDLVLNHASSQHPWFLQAAQEQPGGPMRDLFRFSELPLELFGPWEQRVWHPVPGREHDFYYGVFSADMPDWNFEDARVTEHHRRAARFWLEEVGVDGFRLDAVRYFHEVGEDLQDTAATRQWLREFTEFCHSVKPDVFVIAENTARMSDVARSIRGGSVDSAFEFDLARATLESVRLRAPGVLDRALQRLDQLYGGGSPWATLLTNHDQERARTQLDGHEPLTRLATKILFTLPGVPFVYYGEELGMQAKKPDPELRTPMPWTGEPPNAGFTPANVHAWKPPQPDYPQVNVGRQIGDPDSMLSLYRKLIRLNSGSPALRHGKTVAVNASDRRLYVQMRQTEGEAVLVLGNFSAQPKPGPELATPASAIRTDWRATEELAEADIAPAAINESGGFSRWRPLPELAAESLYVIRWRSAKD